MKNNIIKASIQIALILTLGVFSICYPQKTGVNIPRTSDFPSYAPLSNNPPININDQ